MATKRKFNLKAIVKQLWQNRRTLYWWCGIAIVLGVIFALTNPKEYTVTTAIVPEQSSSTGLASIASMMGVSLGNVEGGNVDAMDPSMFPDIAESIPFLQAMMATKVHTLEDTTTVTLHDYLKTEYVPWTVKTVEALHKFKDFITRRKKPSFDNQSRERATALYSSWRKGVWQVEGIGPQHQVRTEHEDGHHHHLDHLSGPDGCYHDGRQRH